MLSEATSKASSSLQHMAILAHQNKDSRRQARLSAAASPVEALPSSIGRKGHSSSLWGSVALQPV